MRAIPRWFERELKLLDPNLRIQHDQESDMFLLLKDLDYIIAKQHRRETFIRAAFKHLNDSALSEIRYRQYLGRRYMDRPMAYIRWMKDQEAEAKQKIKREGIDMISEGLIRMRKLETSKTFI